MDAVFGTIIFVGAKLFGYFLYFSWIRRFGNGRSAIAMAAFRVLLGLALGGAIWMVFSRMRGYFPAVYFGAILLGRLVAWSITVRWGFPAMALKRTMACVAGGTLLSYLIDIPVFFGVLSVIGGIC